MKKVFAILAIFGFMAANSFATSPVNDNTGDRTNGVITASSNLHSGSAVFSCDIFAPFTFTAQSSDGASLNCYLGKFVVSDYAYTGIDKYIQITLSGEKGKSVNVCETQADLGISTSPAVITVERYYLAGTTPTIYTPGTTALTLDASTGNLTFGVKVKTLKAQASSTGTAQTFTFVYTVQYTDC